MPATIGGVPHAEPNDSVSSWQGTSRALAAWIDENTVRRGDIINDAPPADPHTHSIAEVQGLSTRLGAIDAALARDSTANMTAASGFSWRSGNPGQVRRVGSIVFAWGQFTVGSEWGTSGARASMPPEYAPPFEVPIIYTIPGTTAGAIDAWISSAGELRAGATTLRPTYFKFFASYPASTP